MDENFTRREWEFVYVHGVEIEVEIYTETHFRDLSSTRYELKDNLDY